MSTLKRRLWRWTRRGLIGLLALLLLLTAALIGLLATETGARQLLTRGVAFYDGMIPGKARLEGVSGSLISDLTLEGLTLEDREGRSLIAIRRLRVAWSLDALLSEQALDVLGFELEGVDVTLRVHEDGQSALLDLAPPPKGPPPPPPPPSPTLIPAMPIPIHAAARISDVSIYDATRGAPEPLALGFGVEIDAVLEGDHGEVTLSELRVEAPVARNLDVKRGGLTLGWVKNTLTLRDLRLDTNRGLVEIAKLVGDIDALKAELAMRAVAPKALVSRVAQLPPLEADPEVEIGFSGGLYGFSGELRVQISPEAALGVAFKGQALPHAEATVDLRFEEIRPERLGAPAKAHLTGQGRITVVAPPKKLTELGTLKPEDLRVTATLACPDCSVAPAGHFSLDLDAKLDPGAAEVALEAAALGARVALEARVDDLDLQDPLKSPLDARWRVRVADLSKPTRIVPALRGKLAGSISTQGRCKGVLEELRCSGDVKVRAFAGFGAQVEAVDLGFKARPTRPLPEFDADLRVTRARHPAAMGPVDLTLHAQGTPKRVDARLDLKQRRRGGLDRVRLAARIAPGPPLEVNLKSLDARALGHEARLKQPVRVTVDGPVVRWSRLRLAADGADVRLDPGRFDPEGAVDLGLHVRGFDLKEARRAVPDLPAGGVVGLDLALKGSLRRPKIDLEVRGEALRWQGGRLGDLVTQVGYRGGRAEVDVKLNGAADRRQIKLEARAPLALNLATGKARWRPEGPHRVAWRIDGVDSAWITPWVKLPEGIAFDLSTHATLEGADVDTLAGQIKLEGWAEAPQAGRVPLELGVTIAPRLQKVALTATLLREVEVRLDAEAGVALKDARLNRLDVPQIPIKAALRIPKLPLQVAEPWLPDELSRPVGRVALEADVSGRVGQPKVEGLLRLDEGALTVAALGQRLKGMRARVRFHDRGAKIEEIRFKGGDGEGKLVGEVELKEGGVAVGDITFNLDKFPLLNPGVPPSRLNTRIDVALKADPEEKIEVGVDISKTRLQILSLDARAPKSIPTSPYVVFTDEVAARAPEAEPEAPAAPAAPGPPISIKVRFKDPLDVRGPLVDMRWGGAVDVAVAGGPPVITGGLKADGGGFDLLGNRFDLESGEVTLSAGGAVDPYLDLVAHADTPEARVTAKITGRAAAPKLELSAQPALAQYQILTLLVTGSVESGEEGEGEVERKAASLLAAFQNADLERQLQDRVGIDRVRVSFGDSVEEPIVALGKTLSPWLYVETRYHHNAPEEENETEIRAEVRLAPRWTLESLYGDAGIGGLDVFWRVPLSED